MAEAPLHAPLNPDIVAGILDNANNLPEFLGNEECILNKTIEPRPAYPKSPHQILYEIVDGQPAKLIAYAIVEMGSQDEGVKLGAMGNKPDDTNLKDGETVKLVFVGKAAGVGTPLTDLWTDQVATLTEIEWKFLGGPKRHQEIVDDKSNYIVRPFIHVPRDRKLNTPIERFNHQSMHLVTDPLYVLPKGVTSPVRSPQRSARTASQHGSNPTPTSNANEHTAVAPVTVDTTYDLADLPDHIGPRFEQHFKSRVVQFDIKDQNNRLVPPWALWEVFKPGTIVLAAVYFRLWDMEDRTKPGRRSLTFQLCVESMKVLVRSPLDAEPPVMPDESPFVQPMPTPARVKHTLDGFNISPAVSAAADANDFDNTPKDEDVKMSIVPSEDPSSSATKPAAAGPSRKKIKRE